MSGIGSGFSQQEILVQLTSEAQRRWGNDRAEQIKTYLENTAKQIFETENSLPVPEIEPGYFQ
jgi:hypothetical protein